MAHERSLQGPKAEVERLTAWIDDLHQKYPAGPPAEYLDFAYEKLEETIQALMQYPPTAARS